MSNIVGFNGNVFETDDNKPVSINGSLFVGSEDVDSEYASYIKSLTPLAYWKLNEKLGTIAKDYVNNNHATINGSPDLGVEGLVANSDDKAIKFNGNSSDYVEIAAAIANYSIRTIAFSFTPNSTFNSTNTDAQMILYRSDGTNTADFGVYLYAGTGALRFSVRHSGTTYLINTDTVEWVAGTKYNVICTIDSSDGMAVYINGVKQTETQTHSSAIAASAGTDIHLGRIDVSGNYRPYDGIVDDLIFYASSISQAEATEAYTKFSGPSDYADYINTLSPVGYWRLGEKSGNVAIDETGNHDAEYFGGVKLNHAGLVADDDNSAAYFSGAIEKRIEIPTSLTSTVSGAVVFCVNIDNFISGETQYVFTRSNTTNDEWVAIGINSDGAVYVHFFMRTPTQHNLVKTPDNTIVAGNDYNVVVQSIGTAYEFYVNGTKITGLVVEYGLNDGKWFGDSDAPSQSNQIGVLDRTSGIVDHFVGTLDEISYFETVLTQLNVTQIYDNFMGTVAPADKQIFLGDTEITEIYLGDTEITEIYLGDTQVYGP